MPAKGRTAAVVAVAALPVAGPARAFQCPKLIAEINNEAGKRFDNVSYDAKLKAAEAQKLHAEGKHAEAEKAAKDARAAGREDVGPLACRAPGAGCPARRLSDGPAGSGAGGRRYTPHRRSRRLSIRRPSYSRRGRRARRPGSPNTRGKGRAGAAPRR